MAADTSFPRIAFDEWVRRGSEPAKEVIRLSDQLIRMGHQGYILGGVVRDACLFGPDAIPRDVDVAIDAPGLEQLHSIVEDCGYEIERETALGGLKVRRAGVILDLWLLRKTWAANLMGNHRPTISDLVESTPLTTEAVAVQLRPGGGSLERGFTTAMRRRTVEIQCSRGWTEKGLAWRAHRLASRLEFGVGHRACNLISREFSPEELG